MNRLLKKVTVITVITVTRNVPVFWTPKIRLLLLSNVQPSTNEFDPGSLKLDDFRNEGVIKSFKDPGITVEEHLDMITTKQIEAPMFTNAFHLSAYIPKTENPGEIA